METLFGLPLDTLIWVFGLSFLAILGTALAIFLRQPVLVRLGVRYIQRRPGRTALIVAGLMLGTSIITAALSTGDTMTHTVRVAVLEGLGNADEVISSQEESDIEITGEAIQLEYIDESAFDRVRAALDGSTLVDGIAPVIVEDIAVQDLASRQSEPRVQLFASDPEYLTGFGEMKTQDGTVVTLSDLSAGELYINEDGAEELDAAAGDDLQLLVAGGLHELRVKSVITSKGTGNAGDPAVFVPLPVAQDLLGKKGKIKHIVISNRGDEVSGAALSDDVVALVKPTLDELGLSAETTKKDDLQEAEEVGDAFATFFTVFGTFSIFAGMLLIFLIFVMLSAERKPEMGIARAVGIERSHLIQMFMFEGLAYDMAAAAVGAVLGVAVAFGMVYVMALAADAFGLEIRHDVRPRSLVVAYTMGVVLTFIIVAVSAWRVSVLNIVAAIRDLPEHATGHRGHSLLFVGLFTILGGSAMSALGLSSKSAAPFFFGTSLVIIGLIPLIRWLRFPDRVAYTVPGLVLVVWWLLPFDALDFMLPHMSMDFSIFIMSGIMVVTGATWVMIYNSDFLMNSITDLLGRVGALAPIARTAFAYPLKNRFRTGVTLAMFTLVVFTLVVGGTTTTAFTEAFNDEEAFGGGFDVQATTVPVSPIVDIDAAIAGATAVTPADFDVIAAQSTLLVEARQTSTDNAFGAYPVRGLDDAFLSANRYEFSVIAEGYGSAREVWDAVKDNPGLAVVDAIAAPHRENFSFGAQVPDFMLEGFYIEDGTFSPIEVDVRDPVTGAATKITVIAVLKDVAPFFMVGLSTSQQVIAEAFPQQSQPSNYLFRLAPGTEADPIADALESEFLANGLEANVLKEELADLVAANRVFNYIMQGFMGMGLVVGVAALGVISARSVVERRHEIGVMRSIGYDRRMVQVSFLLESSFVAIVGIVLGTALGLAVALNVIRDASAQPNWDNIRFAVPWLNLAIIFLIVYAAALATTFLPALQASRVYPAEALRYR